MKDGRSSHPSIGIDLVEYARARALWISGGARLRRILSRKEWDAVNQNRRPEEMLAKILAGKEATFKASGKFWMGPEGFRSIRVALPAGRQAAGGVSYKRTARYVVATCVGT